MITKAVRDAGLRTVMSDPPTMPTYLNILCSRCLMKQNEFSRKIIKCIFDADVLQRTTKTKTIKSNAVRNVQKLAKNMFI